MSGWLWALIIAAPAGYLRLVAHELAHAAASLATGGRVDWREFRPYPHRINGRWFWGSMQREGGDDLLVAIAPLARALATLPLWIVVAALAWRPLYVCAAWEALEVLHWLRGWIWQPETDGGRARTLLAAKKAEKESQK